MTRYANDAKINILKKFAYLWCALRVYNSSFKSFVELLFIGYPISILFWYCDEYTWPCTSIREVTLILENCVPIIINIFFRQILITTTIIHLFFVKSISRELKWFFFGFFFSFLKLIFFNHCWRTGSNWSTLVERVCYACMVRPSDCHLYSSSYFVPQALPKV